MQPQFDCFTRFAENILQVLYSLLHIDVEAYQQAAMHATSEAREQDLKTGDEHVARLNQETSKNLVEWQGLLGGILILGAQSALEQMPLEILVSSQVSALVKFLMGVLLVTGLIVYVWRRRCRERARRDHIDLIRTNIQEARDLYAAHSGVKLRLQSGQHERIKVDILLRSLIDETEVGTVRGSYAREARAHFDTIAEIDRQRLIDQREYERGGGEYLLQILQATLNYQLPGFVYRYIACAREGKSVTKWATEARILSKAIREVHTRDTADDRLERFVGDQTTGELIESAITAAETAGGYDLDHFQRLLQVCRRRPLDYSGPRAKAPSAPEFQEWIAAPAI